MTLTAQQLMSDNLIDITEFYDLLFNLKKQTFWQLGELIEIVSPTKQLKVGDKIRIIDVCLEAFQLENGEWIGRFEAKTKPIGAKDYKYYWKKIMKNPNVLCESHKESIELLIEADSIGLTYRNGDRYINEDWYKEGRIYKFCEELISSTYKENNYVKASELIKKKEANPMKFNWQLILQPHTVIHCDTEEKAITLLAEAGSRGLEWSDSASYNSKYTFWEEYGCDTCYNLKSGEYGKYITYDEFYNYTILTYEDVLDYKTLCGKLKIGDKIKHKGWGNVTTIDIIGDNMCLEPREKIYVSCEVAIHEENIDWKSTYYANLKGENEVKRINITKENNNDGISISKAKDITLIQLKGNKIYNRLTLVIGDGLLSLTEANTILAPFGYELYDWTKIEVGAEISIKSENNNHPLYGYVRPKKTFKEYVQQTKQIIVFNGNKVEVYNEDEVELV